MNTTLINKLQKLLALAGNNPSQAEAEAAMLKAQSIAMEHGIDLALIGNVSESESESIIQEILEMGQRLPTVNTYVSNILTKFFDVKIILGGSRFSGRMLIFVGTTNSISVAKYIYSWLSETMVRCWKSYYSNNKQTITLDHKQSYLFGFYNGLCDKLRQAQLQTESVKLKTEEHKNNYAIIRRSMETKLENFISKSFPELKHTSTKKIQVNQNSYASGFKDGTNCNISKGSIHNSNPKSIQTHNP